MARDEAPGLKPPRRVFYAAGPGDASTAHEHWKQGVHDPTEVSITFSGQIEQYCEDIGADLYIVCYHNRRGLVRDGAVTIEHLPKFWPTSRGLAFHIRELVYGLLLLSRAVRFRADTAILDSGCTHFFWQSLFRVAGMRVVPVLHNSLWPNGFKPNDLQHRLIRVLDGLFWRYVPTVTLCVSPLCARQLAEVGGPRHRLAVQIAAQFEPDFFARIPPPPPHSRRPFKIMFIGRVVESKGVFDILEMAAAIERRAPGRVRWVICGTGSDFEELKRRAAALRLEGVVELRGWTSLDDLVAVYADSHCSIVPTRSTFIEGLAMTAAEAVLAGRPVITNPVVPALEVLESAVVPCRTNDVASYVEQISRLLEDCEWYASLVAACPRVSRRFLDRRNGITEVLKQTLGPVSESTPREADGA
jgi:glycosyltransferase involved in cell wall biosynthesis